MALCRSLCLGHSRSGGVWVGTGPTFCTLSVCQHARCRTLASVQDTSAALYDGAKSVPSPRAYILYPLRAAF